jgi:hypothetical protein
MKLRLSLVVPLMCCCHHPSPKKEEKESTVVVIIVVEPHPGDMTTRKMIVYGTIQYIDKSYNAPKVLE